VSRVQLALRVADLEASIAFYSKLFGTEPAKLRPGYANFAVANLAVSVAPVTMIPTMLPASPAIVERAIARIAVPVTRTTITTRSHASGQG